MANFEPITDLVHCEQMGYESAMYGANTTNCNFKIFGSSLGVNAWEKGVQRAKEEKQKGTIVVFQEFKDEKIRAV